MNPNPILAAMAMLLAIVGLAMSGGLARGADNTDWITAMPREPVRVSVWPGGRKVAVCFVLYVEVWGYGRGPNFRSDMVNRDPDMVDESFRELAREAEADPNREATVVAIRIHHFVVGTPSGAAALRRVLENLKL